MAHLGEHRRLGIRTGAGDDGHRLADMRRYLKYQQIDLFPRGPYLGTTSGET